MDILDAIENGARDLRNAVTYYGFSESDRYVALALEALLLGWFTALVATAMRRHKAHAAAMASYRKKLHAYKQAAKEANDYEIRRAGVIAALAALDADGR